MKKVRATKLNKLIPVPFSARVSLFVGSIVGGQCDGMGKCKIGCFLAHEYQMTIRSGGPNAGHITIKLGEEGRLGLA